MFAKTKPACSSGARTEVATSIFLIGIGCISNVIILESITRRAPGSASVLSFLQFLFVTISDSSALWKPRSVELKNHVILTSLFFLANFCCSKALDFSITMPLYIVLKASTLVLSLIIGLFRGKSYSRSQLIAVICVTLGIALVTLAESGQVTLGNDRALSPPCCEPMKVLYTEKCDTQSNHCTKAPEAEFQDEIYECSCIIEGGRDGQKVAVSESINSWLIGIVLMIVGVTLQALLGHFQEYIYETRGRHCMELKFYSHILSLPFFATLELETLTSTLSTFTQSATIQEEFASVTPFPFSTLKPFAFFSEVPFLWILVIANIVCQYCCISGIFKLGSVSGTLTCTLVVTCRKFLSLLLSVWYFNNTFTTYHWLGSYLVFGGVLLYSGVWP
mmetsp:Transcript_3852/g.4435  ORF Transcript_3852/g.4435 Transcript_3852/m.4435 type:complete len:391 (+) Transcript_3852:392-1564(+)